MAMNLLEYARALRQKRWFILVQYTWVVLVIVFIAFFIHHNLGSISQYQWQLDWRWLIAAAVAAALRRLAGGMRWALIVQYPVCNLSKAELIDRLNTYFVSNLAQYIPGNVVFIATRLHLSCRSGMTLFRSSAAMVVEIFVNVVTGAAAGLYLANHLVFGLPAWIVMSAFFLVIIALFSPRFVRMAMRLANRFSRRLPMTVPTALWSYTVLLLSTCIWLFGGATFFSCSRHYRSMSRIS